MRPRATEHRCRRPAPRDRRRPPSIRTASRSAARNAARLRTCRFPPDRRGRSDKAMTERPMSIGRAVRRFVVEDQSRQTPWSAGRGDGRGGGASSWRSGAWSTAGSMVTPPANAGVRSCARSRVGSTVGVATASASAVGITQSQTVASSPPQVAVGTGASCPGQQQPPHAASAAGAHAHPAVASATGASKAPRARVRRKTMEIVVRKVPVLVEARGFAVRARCEDRAVAQGYSWWGVAGK